LKQWTQPSQVPITLTSRWYLLGLPRYLTCQLISSAVMLRISTAQRNTQTTSDGMAYHSTKQHGIVAKQLLVGLMSVSFTVSTRKAYA